MNKFNQICATVDILKCEPDVIVFTEVKLKPACSIGLYNIKAYSLLSCLRDGGGGVIVYIKSSLQIKSSSILANKYEKITAVIASDNFEFRFIAYYRAPLQANLQDFLNDLENEISASNMKTIIVGDINIHSPVLSVRLITEDHTSRQYLELLASHGYCVTNNHQTRPISGRNIDHVTTNFCDQYKFHNDVIEMDSTLTDHNSILTTFNCPHNCQRSVHLITRTKIDYKKLIDNFPNIEQQVLLCDDPNEITTIMTSALRAAVDASSNTRTFPVKHPEKIKDWMSAKTIELIMDKDKLLCKHRKKPYSKKIKTDLQITSEMLIRNSRKDYADYVQKNVSTTNRAKMWRGLNKIIGRGRDNATFKLVNDDGSFTSDDAEVAERFNKFFSECAAKVMKNQNYANEEQRVEYESPDSLVLQAPTKDDIEIVIKTMKGNSAAGHDGLAPKVFKTLNDQISPMIAHLICTIFKTGTYPTSLKLAVITPIFKGGSKTSADNYRPISVLPVLNKVLERVIYKQLFSFFDHKLKNLYDHQFGFRPKCGTENAAIELVNLIMRAIDNKKIPTAIFMDLRKAFDIVNHDLLLQVLEKYGVREKALDVFKSYLSERTQIVKIGNSMSGTLSINSGVVQGSCLGPLLFLIFINAIGSLETSGKLFLFADDAVLINIHENILNMQATMAKDMIPVTKFFDNRQMQLNKLKTNFMIFSSSYTNIDSPWSISLSENLTIQRVTACKYLGLYIDEHLRWSEHLVQLEKKLTSANWILWKLRDFLPFHAKKLIYDSLFQSHLNFMSPVWGLASCIVLSNAQVLQNRALRNVYGLPKLSNRVDMFTHRVESHLPIRAIALLNIASYVFNVLNRNTHSNLKFVRSDSVHARELRNMNFLRPAPKRTNYGAKSIESIGPNIYNKIPADIRTSRHQHAFKWTLKCHLRKEKFITSCFDNTFFNLVF
jgi:hypothetical protein